MMIWNYFRVAFRNMKRHKGYTLVNGLGLALGFAGALLIGLFVKNELSYDTFHKNAGRIYRLGMYMEYNGRQHKLAMTPPGYAPVLKERYTEVEDFARLLPYPSVVLIRGENRFTQSVMFADGNLFEIFSFPMVYGPSEGLLRQKNRIVLSRSAAKKYFGDENPVGRTLSLNNERDLLVDGVFEDIPRNSHIRFHALVSMPTIADEAFYGTEALNEYYASNFYSYLLASPDAEPAAIKEAAAGLVREFHENPPGRKLEPFLESLPSIYLHSDAMYGTGQSGEFKYVLIFSGIALFILIMASINFINLTTARSATRAREIGIRKVSGGDRLSLVRQFLTESAVMSLLSMGLALIAVWAILPHFNRLTGKALSLNFLAEPVLLVQVLALALGVGLVSGLYPALALSAITPARVLKGHQTALRAAGRMRKALVVFQFMISVALIFGSLTIYKQMRYLQEKDLGFNKDNMLVISLSSSQIREKSEVLKQELLSNPDVLGVTVASRQMGAVYGGWSVETDSGDEVTVTAVYADPDYLRVHEMDIAEGRDFSREMTTDKNAYLINEAAAEKLGRERALGMHLTLQRVSDGHVIGIVRDVNHRSLHQRPEPLVITGFPSDSFRRYMTVKIRGGNISATIASIRGVWKKMEPNQPFAFHFLDETLDELYWREKRTGRLVLDFTLLAILICGLGLFALASYAAQQRTKEIGVRKVLGAGPARITAMLCWDFLKTVLAAVVLAAPFAWWFMSRWLANYAYRIQIDPGLFVMTALTALGIALLTVGCQALNAACTDPVKALKYE